MNTPPSKKSTPPSDNTTAFIVCPLIAWVIAFGTSFFAGLNGVTWLWCYALAVLLGVIGCAFIFYAKLPLYRERRFFTWGITHITPKRRFHYRLGKRLSLLAILLLLCLLLLTRHGLHGC